MARTSEPVGEVVTAAAVHGPEAPVDGQTPTVATSSYRFFWSMWPPNPLVWQYAPANQMAPIIAMRRVRQVPRDAIVQ